MGASTHFDFALTHSGARVVHAFEYQGNGHYQGRDAARSAGKDKSSDGASIGYHEVVAGHTTAGELRRLVEKLVPGGG